MNRHFHRSLALFPVLIALAILGLAFSQSGSGQASTPAGSSPAPPAAAAKTPQAETRPAPLANPADVDSIQHIIAAVYDVISGQAGAPRNWDRFRSLYYPGARMIPSRREEGGKVSARAYTVEEYIERSSPFFAKEGFYESPVSQRVEVWDHIAHVWSTYESRHAKGGQPFARGINSFQLIHDGTRWWVLTVYWEGEDPAHPLPENYLK